MPTDALLKSIQRWEQKLTENRPQRIFTGPKACPLCRLYYYDGCDGCPVKRYTGESYCINTPYETAAYALRDWQLAADNPDLKVKFRDAAQEEIDFLKSLVRR